MAEIEKYLSASDREPRLSGTGSVADLLCALDAAAATGVPLMVVGEPGVGKTAIVSAWSETHGCGEPVCVVGSQMDPTDAKGLPYPSSDRASTVYLRPEHERLVLERCQGHTGEGPACVLFFDEFSNTPRSVQASLLKTIGERRFADGTPMPASVVIVCAMNPGDTAADYTELSAPMVNRMMTLSFAPSADYVANGIEDAWGKGASDAESGWRRLVARFLRANSAQMSRLPDLVTRGASGTCAEAAYEVDGAADASERHVLTHAWASPRSWDNACRVLATTGAAAEPSPAQVRLLRGLVGPAGASAFCDWAHANASVDPFDLIRDIALLDWAGCSANEAMEAAEQVAGAVGQCDGTDGRPSPEDVMTFYERAAGIAEPACPAAAPYLAPHMTDGSCALEGLNRARSLSRDPQAITRRRLAVLVAFSTADNLLNTRH